jgi:hypothetical protein
VKIQGVALVTDHERATEHSLFMDQSTVHELGSPQEPCGLCIPCFVFTNQGIFELKALVLLAMV